MSRVMWGKPFTLPVFTILPHVFGWVGLRAFFLAWLLVLPMPRAAFSAPIVPNAGQILESIPPAPVAPATRPVMPQREEMVRPAMGASDKIRIPLRGIRISGATIYPAATLEKLLRDVIGTELTLHELDAAVQRITRYYRDHDCMLARAYIPAQDIRDGIVEIAVLEGYFGEIVVRNQSGLNDRAAHALTKPLKPGAAITGRAVERATLLANDLSGVEAASTLRPGTTVGTSDLVMELRDGKPRDASLEFDNAGGRYTGRSRLGGGLAFNNLTGRGDRIFARMLSSGGGMTYGLLAYQLPVGYDGTILDFYVSQADYQLGRDFASLDASGRAHVAGVAMNQALIRSRNTNLRTRLGFDYKVFHDRSLASDTVNRSRTVSFGLLGDHAADYGNSTFSALITSGRLDTAETTAGLRGGFSKLVLNATLAREIGSRNRFSISYSGQAASKNLNSSEKMSLGGPSGVRAYPQAEAAGDDVHMINLELRHASYPFAKGVLNTMLLVDFGVSRLVHEAWTGYTGDQVIHLSSVGLGLAYQVNNDWTLRADYAWKLGKQKAQSEPDSNGRFWLQASKLF
jgi:hemolysin activation/secretion protein